MGELSVGARMELRECPDALRVGEWPTGVRTAPNSTPVAVGAE